MKCFVHFEETWLFNMLVISKIANDKISPLNPWTLMSTLKHYVLVRIYFLKHLIVMTYILPALHIYILSTLSATLSVISCTQQIRDLRWIYLCFICNCYYSLLVCSTNITPLHALRSTMDNSRTAQSYCFYGSTCFFSLSLSPSLSLSLSLSLFQITKISPTWLYFTFSKYILWMGWPL